MNSQAFTPNDIKKGLHIKLVNTLLEISNELEGCTLQIKISSDGYCTLVDWVEKFEDIPGESFELVDEETQEVMEYIRFPDRTGTYCLKEDVVEEKRKWLTDHPGWDIDYTGEWVKVEQQEVFTDSSNKEDVENNVYEENGIPQ